jgi:hypothetical protein
MQYKTSFITGAGDNCSFDVFLAAKAAQEVSVTQWVR